MENNQQMTQEDKSQKQEEDLQSQIGLFPHLELMIKYDLPMTRESYLNLIWPDRTKEDEEDAEFESQIPPMFRKK